MMKMMMRMRMIGMGFDFGFRELVFEMFNVYCSVFIIWYVKIEMIVVI